MSNYVKATNFATKDTLPSGNAGKIVKGTEIDDEFNAIASAISSKADTASPTFTGVPAAPTAVAGTSTTQIATTAFVTSALQAAYPVGSIYMNATNAQNPGTLLGFGTWTAFGAGRMPVGFNSADPLFDTPEETGGTKDAIVVSHSHTIENPTISTTTSLTGTLSNLEEPFGSASGIVSLSNVGQAYYGGSGSTSPRTATINANHNHTFTGSISTTGSSGTNANLPPYIVVYMWKRTA